MKGFTLLKRSCPICNGARNDCRQSVGTNWIHCHDAIANPTGYTFRGLDAWGFGMWQFWKDAEAYGNKSKEDREREREQHRIEWERQRQERIGKQLPVSELNRLYSHVLSQLRLTDSHKLHLKQDRGFTDEQLEADGFKSVEQWQKVPGIFPANLPGVLRAGFGQTTFNVQEGIIYPVRNEAGLIVALHLRKKENVEGRYRFLTSATKKNPEGATAHVNGELPIAVFEPRECAVSAIWAIEGLGIKPSLARYLSNAPTIGANAGNFKSSPEATKTALATLAPKYQTNRINIAPDAGDVVNPQAFQKWQKQIEFFTNDLGYEVAIAWWGQLEKGKDRDIDELSEFERELIEFIDPDKFYKIAQKAQQELKQRQKEEEEAKQREIDDARHRELTSITETPWKVVNTPQLNPDELGLEPGAIYILVSGKGTCKTSGVAVPLVTQATAALSVTHLRSLGRESSTKLNIPWQDDIKIDGVAKLACTINSVYKTAPYLLSKEGSVFLMDEADQVIHQSFEDICNASGERPQIFRSVEHHGKMAVTMGGYAVFMSADVTQKEIDLIKRLYPGLPVRVIINEHKPKMGKLYFDESSKPDQLIDKILKRCKAGLPTFVVSDFKGSVRGCKSIAELIRRQCPSLHVREINGDNTKHPEVIEFLKHIDKASRDVDVIICSPAVTSGISIENQRFIGGVFGIFFGMISVSKACQALVRIRGAEFIHVWAANKGKGAKKQNGLTNPEEIKRRLYDNYSHNSQHIQSFLVDSQYDVMTKEWLSPWLDLYCKNVALENLDKKDFRRRMREKLLEEGYEFCKVEESEPAKSVAQELERGWKEITITQAKALDNASVMSDEQYELYKQISKEPKVTPQEQQFLVERQADFKKTVIYHSLGEELISLLSHEVKMPVEPELQPEEGKTQKETVTLSGYAAAAIKGNDHFKAQLNNYHLLRCDISEAAAQDWRREATQLEFSGERFAADITWNARKKAAREFLEMPQFIDEWKDAPKIPDKAFKAMATRIRSHLDLLRDVLGLDRSNPKILDAQLVGDVFLQVGIKIDSKRDRKKQTYERWINKESLAFCEAYHQHKLRQKAEREAKAQAKLEALEVATEYLTRSEPLKEVLATDRTLEASEAAAAEKSELEQLVEALPFAESPEDFASIIEGSPLEAVEDAIVMQDTQPRRQQLRYWLEAIQKPIEPSLGLKVGDCLKLLRGVFEGRIARVVEVFDWGVETSLGAIAFSEMSGWGEFVENQLL